MHRKRLQSALDGSPPNFEDPDGIIIELIQLPSLEEAKRVHKASQQTGA